MGNILIDHTTPPQPCCIHNLRPGEIFRFLGVSAPMNPNGRFMKCNPDPGAEGTVQWFVSLYDGELFNSTRHFLFFSAAVERVAKVTIEVVW